MDLELDNLENLDLDNLAALDEDVTNFGEVQEEINEPHISISKTDLQAILKIASKTVMTSNDLYTKSIAIEPAYTEVNMYITDYVSSIKVTVPNLNTDAETSVQKPIFLPIATLVKLFPTLSNQVNLIVRENSVLVRIFGGEFNIENFVLQLDKFKQETTEVKETYSIQSEILNNQITAFLPYLSTLLPDSKRIFFKGTQALMYSPISSLVYNSENNLDLVLTKKDAEILKILTTFSETMTVKVGEDSVTVESAQSSYTFTQSDMTPPQKVYDNYNSVQNNKIYVDYNSLNRLLALSTDLQNSTKKVTMYIEGDDLCVELQMKNNTSKHKLGGTIEGTPSDKKVTLNSQIYKKLLNTLSQSISVAVEIQDNQIITTSDNITTILAI